MAQLPALTWQPNNNFFANRNGQKARYIIVHGTAGGSSAQDIAAYFASTQGTANPVTSHYVIGQDGAIVQCVSLLNGAWANGFLSPGHDAFWDNYTTNPNNITVSIEHVKPSTDNSDALTPAQQAASFALIDYICSELDIPRQKADATGGITGHFSLDPVNRSNCPGQYPFDALYQYLNPPAAPAAPGPAAPGGSIGDTMFSTSSYDFRNYWIEQGTHWHCTRNGYNIGGAIRQYYCNLSIDGHQLPIPGLPLSNEISIGTDGQVVQHFERFSLVFDPTLKALPPGAKYQVYVPKLDDSVYKK